MLAFVRHSGLVWPREASALLLVSVGEVQQYRDALAAAGAAPKTINHRVSALSSFYKYLALSAAELRLPVVIPNPAHSQFIARESSDPREETLSLSAARARQLLHMAAGLHPFVAIGPEFRTAGNLNSTLPSNTGVSAGAGLGIHFRFLDVVPVLRYTRWQSDKGLYRTKSDQLELLINFTHTSSKLSPGQSKP